MWNSNQSEGQRKGKEGQDNGKTERKRKSKKGREKSLNRNAKARD